MSDEISFQLFGEGGFINPTPWSYGRDNAPERWALSFYDAASGRFFQKQGSDFDGGWRWFDAYDLDALTIYNRKLDMRAYFHLTHTDIVNTPLQPEVLLLWAKCMVIVDHNYYMSKNWLEDKIRAMARQAAIDIKREIRGDDKPTHLHSVR